MWGIWRQKAYFGEWCVEERIDPELGAWLSPLAFNTEREAQIRAGFWNALYDGWTYSAKRF